MTPSVAGIPQILSITPMVQSSWIVVESYNPEKIVEKNFKQKV